MSTKYRDMEERLITNSVLCIETGCWLWTGAKDKRASTPYGKMSTYCRDTKRKLKRQAHRVSYETFKGPIPDGQHVDHTCRNPQCINPDHLEAVQPKENYARRVFKRTARSDAYVGDAQ